VRVGIEASPIEMSDNCDIRRAGELAASETGTCPPCNPPNLLLGGLEVWRFGGLEVWRFAFCSLRMHA